MNSENRFVLICDDMSDIGDAGMEFRLTYEGPLHAASSRKTRSNHKHEIRKKFHRQLKRLWEVNPYLKNAKLTDRRTNVVHPPKPLAEHLAKQYERLGYNFVPLVTESLRLRCKIDILYLRQSILGRVMQHGDIDNRLKTIFDAFKMPACKEQLGGCDTPEGDEKPFYCLLEDDELISSVTMETDTLLEPTSANGEWQKNDARLVINISLHPFDLGWDNISFG